MTRRVLIVDDDEPSRRLAVRMLRELYEIVEARGAEDALERIAEAGPFDVVVCSLQLEGGGCIDLYESLSRIAPEHARRMMFVTGPSPTERETALLRELDGRWIEQPYRQQDLRAIVDAMARLGMWSESAVHAPH